MNEIKKTTLHPDNQPNVDLYPKTSVDQVEGLNNIITGINDKIEKKVNTVDNFVRIFTIPNGVSKGTLTAEIKEKLCNPDGHNYYVYDDTSQMILKYSFNADNEIIQYKAVYLQTYKAYEITMQILPSNGSWSRSQTVLNVDLYPKTSVDQVEGLNNIITGINDKIEKKVNTVDNFVRIFTIPNGVSKGTLTAEIKEKLCNPDGHNYYVYDDTSQMILKYSFNADNEIIQYKAVYLQTYKAYEITMQILPSNGSWSRSQTVLNVPASAGEKFYKHLTTYNYEDSTRGPTYITVITFSSTATKYTANSYDSLVNYFVCGYKYSSGNTDYETIINLDGATILSTYVTNCISSSGGKSQYVGSNLGNFTDMVTEL